MVPWYQFHGKMMYSGKLSKEPIANMPIVMLAIAREYLTYVYVSHSRDI